MNERSFTDLGKLYAYLASLPEDTDVRAILKAPAGAYQFYKRYRHIVLPRGSVGWIEASNKNEAYK